MIRLLLLLTALAAWQLAGSAEAQVRSSTGSAFGSTSGGSFGSANWGSGLNSGGNQQGGSFGLTGAGQGGVQPGGLQQGAGGQQRGFVGNDAQDSQNMFQNLNGRDRRRAMFNFALDSLNEMRDSRRRWQNRNRTPPAARVKLTPEIDIAPLAPADTAAVLNQRLGQVLAPRGGASVTVAMDGRTAVLTGAVASEHDKALAEKMASFEPGVSEVQNLLTVADQ